MKNSSWVDRLIVAVIVIVGVPTVVLMIGTIWAVAYIVLRDILS